MQLSAALSINDAGILEARDGFGRDGEEPVSASHSRSSGDVGAVAQTLRSLGLKTRFYILQQ